ncbi:hypothetical protein HYW94_02875 [Candidatus Uhrbacteria bacterium]|nr:hypothetical protein [Candidatus Uhrbacteria bacterium]
MMMSFDEAVVWRSEYPYTSNPEDLSSYGGHALSVEVQEQIGVWQTVGVFDKLEIWSSRDKHEDSILMGKRNEVIYLLAHWDKVTRYVLTAGGLCFEYETLARRCMRSSLYYAISASFLLVAGLSVLLLSQRSLLGSVIGAVLFVLGIIAMRLWKECKISNDHYRQIIDANVALRKTLRVAQVEQ